MRTTDKFVMSNGQELSRRREMRRIYKDRTTNKRYVRSMDRIYPLNDANEWRQEAGHCITYRAYHASLKP